VRRWAEPDKRRLVLGADASTSRDLTALVGCVWNPEANRSEAVYCRVWRPERGIFRFGKPTIDLDMTIGAEVLRLHKLGAVASVVFDPYQLHVVALGWEKAGVKCMEMPQTGARVESDQALYDSILGRTLAHCGDPTLSEHVLNAVAVETPRGFRLAKEKTSRKIDAAVALSMSHFGAAGKGAVRVAACGEYGGSDEPSEDTRFVASEIRERRGLHAYAAYLAREHQAQNTHRRRFCR
jgi:phage terminase large subunit-like protein